MPSTKVFFTALVAAASASTTAAAAPRTLTEYDRKVGSIVASMVVDAGVMPLHWCVKWQTLGVDSFFARQQEVVHSEMSFGCCYLVSVRFSFSFSFISSI